MDSAVRSVGLDCCYVMVVSAVSMVHSTARAWYNSVPTTLWNFFSSLSISEVVSSSGAYCILAPY